MKANPHRKQASRRMINCYPVSAATGKGHHEIHPCICCPSLAHPGDDLSTRVAMICLPVFIGSLDLTIVSAFLPEVILDLGLPLQTTLDDAAWIVTGYLLAYAVSMMFMGRLSDLIGRRKVYVACLIVFMIGSVMVATR